MKKSSHGSTLYLFFSSFFFSFFFPFLSFFLLFSHFFLKKTQISSPSGQRRPLAGKQKRKIFFLKNKEGKGEGKEERGKRRSILIFLFIGRSA